jgi:hypothetical protein
LSLVHPALDHAGVAGFRRSSLPFRLVAFTFRDAM